MLHPRAIARRLRTLLNRRRFEEELDEELQFHLECEIERNVAAGMTPEGARLAAMRSFGGVEQTKIECREVGGFRPLEEIVTDVRYGLRILRKAPGFTAAAVLTLMLGIGANSAVFSVVEGVLLRPLPFPDSDRIMTLWNTYPGVDESLQEASPPDFCDWREESRSFAQMAAYERFVWNLAGDPEPVRVRGVRVSGDFFAVMGVGPALGRPLLPTDDHEGVHHVVVLSHRLWTRRFAADLAVVGRTVILTGVKHTIVGVMPAGFEFPGGVDLWSPLAYEPPFSPSLRRSVWLRTVARLQSGVTVEQARGEMSVIARRLARQYPDTNEGRSVAVVSLLDSTVGRVRTALLVLLGAVNLVLLIACANVVNLSLARAGNRQREIALRAALGASRLRIARQMGTESTLLGLLGGLGGLLLAWLSLAVLRQIAAESVPRLADVHVDLRVLLFTSLVSLAVGAVVGIVPAVAMTGRKLQRSLQGADPRSSNSRGRKRWRHTLVVAEVALAEVLVIGGFLLVQSFMHMRNVSLGFAPRGIFACRFDLHARRYGEVSARESFYRETVEHVAALPGVRSAALATTIPTGDVQMTLDFLVDGRPAPSTPAESPWAGYNSVTPDYFRTMGIDLLYGRVFTQGDGSRAPAVAIVNAETARRYWPGENPLGRTITLRPDDPADSAAAIELVGVVENVRQVSLTSDVRPELYLPYAQHPWREGFILLRSDLGRDGVAASVRRELRVIDPNLALSDLRPMTGYIAASLGSPRFQTVLVATFAGLALVLASVGIFGVVSYSVSQRDHELAIRMALGAQPSEVFRLVAGHCARLVLCGVVLGVVLALALTDSMSALLFGIKATDPLTYVMVALVLSAVAMAACFPPCWRATRIDPAVALRAE
jgi:predicted permease